MRPSSTVMQIWRLTDNGVTTLTFGDHDVIGQVTIRLAVGHCDLAFILHRYGDMAPQTLDGRTNA